MFCLDEKLYEEVFTITGEVIVKKRMPYSYLLQRVLKRYENIKEDALKIKQAAEDSVSQKNVEIEIIKDENASLQSKIRDQEEHLRLNQEI